LWIQNGLLSQVEYRIHLESSKQSYVFKEQPYIENNDLLLISLVSHLRLSEAGTYLTSVTVAAHKSFTADSVPHVFSSAELSRTLCTNLVKA